MDITLYMCGDSPNKINKTLKNERTVAKVTFQEDNTLDMVNPTLLLHLGDNLDDIRKYNYVHIPKFGRYYFINQWSAENGLIRLACHCDVLYSFRTSINASNQYISRSQSIKRDYMVDNLLPFDSRNSYTVKKFGNSVDDRNCVHVILETVGKGGAYSG